MDILLKIINWVKTEDSIRTIILTGSRAEKTISDDLSDYDINIFCDDIEPYIQKDQWISSIENMWVYISEKRFFNNKLYPTRLVIFKNGIKVDFTFFTNDVLNNLVKKPSLPDEFNIGYKILLDKDNITKNLKTPSYEGFKTQKPSEKEFLYLIDEFWFEVYHIAKYLKRKDLWSAKFRDSDIKSRLLIKMIEWNMASKHNWNYTTHHIGKKMNNWVDDNIWNDCFKIFAHFNTKDSWEKLFNMINLFRTLSKETSKNCGFHYPYQLDENITNFITDLHKKNIKNKKA